MSLHRVLILAGVAGTLMLPFAAVHAQQAKATAVDFGNKSIPGVCMLSRDVVLANSTVGKAATARLNQLAQQARSQLDAERKPLDASIQQFRDKAASMTAAARESEQKALQDRAQAFQKEVQELDARLGATRTQAMQKIGAAVNPLVADIYKQHECAILLDRDSVLAGNHSNDLTEAVIAALNKTMTTISFDLAPLPQQSAK